MKAVIAGSFDPITLGHSYVIEQGFNLFDSIYVLIAENSVKQGLFTLDERSELIKNSLADKYQDKLTISILPRNKITVKYAKDLGASHIIRGIRNSTDFEYEAQLNLINKEIVPDVETIFILPPRSLIEVSSSMVKAMLGLEDWEKIAKRYVSDVVLEALKTKIIN